jgi:hypothetical protein
VNPRGRQRVIGPPACRLVDGAEVVDRQEWRSVAAVNFKVLIPGVPRIDQVVVVEAMIDADVACILIERTAINSDKIRIDHRIDVGMGRQPGVFEQELRDRTDSGRIDCVGHASIRQRLSLPVGCCCSWIVQVVLPALRVDQPAEIAVAHFLRGNRHARRCVGDELRCLPIEKEEGTVPPVVKLRNDHRTAQRKAVFVPVHEGCFVVVVFTAARHAISAVAVRVKQVAVELIGASACGHDDRCGAGELSRGVVHFNAKFFERIERRLPCDVPSFPNLILRRAVDQQNVCAGTHPVALNAPADAMPMR